MKKSILLAGAAVSLAMSGTANATITIYTSLASFLAAVGTSGTDTYTGFSITGTTPSPIVRTAGPFGYTGTVGPTSPLFYGAGTAANPWLSTNNASDTITFSSFTGGTVVGLGGNFFDSNISGAFAAGDIIITATDSSGTVSQTIIGATTTSFLGFVSTTAILSATVTAVQPASPIWPTVDNLVLAGPKAATPAVPEPASWAMMIGGFGLVGVAMRRRVTRVSFV